MNILLSEGSGLTSRQTARILAAAGHRVGVLSADPLGLTRFTRAVAAWHPGPPFGVDPFAWLKHAVAVARQHRYAVLLPTQEQVTVLSAVPLALRHAGVATAVPPWPALAAVQDKLSASVTLQHLGLPQPAPGSPRTQRPRPVAPSSPYS